MSVPDWWTDDSVRVVGHGWPGRLWTASSAVVSQHWRHYSLFRHQ